MISTPLDVETFTFYVPGCVPVSPSLLSMWTLNRMSILLLYENCMNLNYIEWIHSAFQVYCILLFLYISTNFWEFDIETPTKNLNLVQKVIIRGTMCNFVLYFPSLL